jgi:hypothetical protein
VTAALAPSGTKAWTDASKAAFSNLVRLPFAEAVYTSDTGLRMIGPAEWHRQGLLADLNRTEPFLELPCWTVTRDGRFDLQASGVLLIGNQETVEAVASRTSVPKDQPAHGGRRTVTIRLEMAGLADGRPVRRAAPPTPHRTTQSEADVLHTGPRQRERSMGEAVGLGRTRQEREHYQYRTVTHEEIGRACRRGPEVQTPRVVGGAHRADLRGSGLAGPPYETGVPGRTEADRLGENGGLAIQATGCRASWPEWKAAMSRRSRAGVN